MRNYKFISLVFLMGWIFSGCQKEEVKQNVCLEIVGDDCNHLCDNERMTFLSENTETGTCVMSIFLNNCPHEFLVGGELVDSEGWMEYFYNKPLNDSVLAASQLVHESMHSISGKVSQPNEEILIVLDCEQSWIVPITEVFSTSEIKSEIPEENKTLRFETYLESPTNTIDKGIYRLLGEFSAYYQGSKAILETGISLNLIDIPSRAEIYSNNSVIPYFEFKYWILTYLIYAEENHLNIFNSILSNEEFVLSFNELNQHYLDLVKQFTNFHDPSDDVSKTAFRNVLETLESQPYLLMIDRID